VRALRLNHVSIHADDLEESARFYEQLFELERLPTPRFGDTTVVWLSVGEQQLHLFTRETGPPRYHHFGIEVDDFEAVYVRAKELHALEPTTFGRGAVRELPDGSVQMYLRDPAGNLVEVVWPDASTLDRSVVTELTRLSDEVEQDPDAARATLFHAAELR
jgi:catechol 2,3-dioxygenase-like lactoylglutathione lyase family enzyme